MLSTPLTEALPTTSFSFTSPSSHTGLLHVILDAENRIKIIPKQDEVTIDTEEALNNFKEVIEDPSITYESSSSSQKSLCFKVDSHKR